MRPIKPGQQRLDVGGLNRRAAPDAQARRRVPIGGHVVGNALALQQGLLATTLSQSSSQELFSEIGVEAAAIDRLAGSVDGADDQTALLRQQNTRHAGQIRDDAATDLDGRDAYAPYDEITQTLVTGVTKTLDDAAGAAAGGELGAEAGEGRVLCGHTATLRSSRSRTAGRKPSTIAPATT